MKGDKPLSDFIKTNGIYQSTAKVLGEIHAACFMFETSWTYIRFKKDFQYFQSFNSRYNFSNLEKIKEKVKRPNLNLINNSNYIKLNKENSEDGTFSFDQLNDVQISKHFYGHFRKDFISGEDELLLIGQDSFSDIYKFIEIRDNLKLEFELLNLFSKNKYVKVNNGLPDFGQTDLEGVFAFEKLETQKYIQPSGTHHLDCYDFLRTKEGDEYFTYLKGLNL